METIKTALEIAPVTI